MTRRAFHLKLCALLLGLIALVLGIPAILPLAMGIPTLCGAAALSSGLVFHWRLAGHLRPYV